MIAATHNTNALSNSTSIDKYIMRKEQVKHHLMNNTLLSTLTLSLPQNIKYIQYYQELFNCLIPIHTFQPKKLEEPDIPKIQIEKTDTNEIKKMIRKLNIEKQISLSDIKKINEKIIAINNKLIEIESFFKSLKCHKCEHILKKYLITKETIEEMRQELKEERELAEAFINEVAEDKYSIDTFMKKHYPSIERVLLKDICDKYKEVYGIHKTLAQMKDELEPLGFKISNVSHKYYVSRI